MNDNLSNNENDNNNSNFNLSSVLSKLSELNETFIRLSESQKKNTELISTSNDQKQYIQNEISERITALSNIMEDRISGMVETLKKQHVLEQRSFGLKIQQEIASLKKEKFELQTKISNLNKRIEEVEINIGYDPK